MPEEIVNPLLALVKAQGLIDDLQYEEVAAEVKRSGTRAEQVLQDFGILDLDAILQVQANHLGTEVVSLRNQNFPPELLSVIPANTARLYQCLPVEMSDGAVRVAFMDPLDTTRIDELTFVLKKDIQVVVANPADIEKAIEQNYGQESASVSEILKQLGADEEIAKEVTALAETDDEAIMASLANGAPIVRFVNQALLM